jgi:hypothetical protein
MRITFGANSKQCEHANFRERENREETNRVMKITQMKTVICFPKFGSKEPTPH